MIKLTAQEMDDLMVAIECHLKAGIENGEDTARVLIYGRLASVHRRLSDELNTSALWYPARHQRKKENEK